MYSKSEKIQNSNSGFYKVLMHCRFYTLMVLSTALFGKPAFRNLICNGLVLAEDGKKMSKRLKNYPQPSEVINDYGAVSCANHELLHLLNCYMRCSALLIDGLLVKDYNYLCLLCRMHCVYT